MKNTLLLILFCLSLVTCNHKPETFSVLQFNIWQEGTIVPGGYEGIVSQILESKADFITFSEVRNYNDTRFCDRIVQSLKDSGQVFYSFYSYDSGILSRYPIIDSLVVFPPNNDHGSLYKAVVDMDGKEVALYTAHLDYLNCTYYDIKGYNGSTWEKRSQPLTNMDSILENNTLSQRDDAILAFINEAKKDKEKNRIIIIGGDFNEPSHLDWTDNTKNMFDRQGLIVPWTVSKMLEKEGYTDTFREKYPDPAKNPGITYPADCPGVEIKKLTWAPDSDERERIDFIHYFPHRGLHLKDAFVWGPKGSIANSKKIIETENDKIEMGKGTWPTDHKAVLAIFTLE